MVFFLLALVLIIPFWVLGSLSVLELMPGLPVAGLGFVCPMLAALILMYREDKGGKIRKEEGSWQIETTSK